MEVPRFLLISILILPFVVYGGCNRDEGTVVGRFMVVDGKDQPSRPVFLELGIDGRGSWAIEEDNVYFRWEAKGEQIWIHSKTGGVLSGRITGDTIEINLPGVGICYFRKVKSWK